MTTALGPTNSKPRAAKAAKVASDSQSPGFDRCIPLDVDSELTQKTRAFVLQQLDRIEELTKRLEKREAKPAPKPTPQNSSLPPSTSMTVKMQNVVSEALATPHEDLRSALSDQFNVHMDETPTKEKNNKAWMWVATTTRIAVFAIFSSRAASAITHLLGEDFKGIVNCDRAKMYYLVQHLQWCWSHLIRDIQAMIDSGVPDRVFLGQKLDEQTKAMFHSWHRYKSQTITWEEFQAQTIPIAKKFNELLYQGGGSHDSKLRNQCLALHKHHENLWRFLCNKGIEPTNNAAERALRGPVIYRKLSFGTQSEAGSRFVERVFSIVETCRLQKRSTYDYLAQAVTAHFTGKSAPNLLDP